jgi:hypothetical protein
MYSFAETETKLIYLCLSVASVMLLALQKHICICIPYVMSAFILHWNEGIMYKNQCQ